MGIKQIRKASYMEIKRFMDGEFFRNEYTTQYNNKPVHVVEYRGIAGTFRLYRFKNGVYGLEVIR